MKTRLIALKHCWNILEILDGLLLVVLLCFRTQESHCSTFWNISLEHCTMKVYIVCECLHYTGILFSFYYVSAMQKEIFQDNFYKNNKYICEQFKTSQCLLYLLGDSYTLRSEWKSLNTGLYIYTLQKKLSTFTKKHIYFRHQTKLFETITFQWKA